MFRHGITGKVARLKLSECWISWAYCELYCNSAFHLSETHENTIFSVAPCSFCQEVYIYYSLSKVVRLLSTHNCACRRHINHRNHLQFRNKLDVSD